MVTRITELRRNTRPTLKSIRKELSFRKRLEKKQRKEKAILKEVKRERSISNRLGKTFTKSVSVGRKGIARSLYDRERLRIQPSRVQGTKGITRTGGIATGKKGRPKGSYDQRYARWGGVYGYRKAMAQKRRLERIQAMRNVNVTPRQQETLRRIEYNRQVSQQRQQQNPFFGTDGNVPLGGIMDEINRATRLVD